MNRKILLYAVGTSLLLEACTPTYYKPNALNVPLLAEKEKGSISATSDFSKAFNFNAAIAVTNDIGVTTNYASVIEGDHSGNLLEFGIGYMHSFAEKFHLEAYLGYGFGTFKTYQDSSGKKFFTMGDINRGYVQP